MDAKINENDFRESCLSSEDLFEGRVIHVFRDKVSLPDGGNSVREYVRHRGAVAVVAIDEEENVYLVRQYRYAYGESLYEIPAGKLEKGEAPLLAAARELEEEAGVRSQDFDLLYVCYPTPGYTNEKIYIYRANGGEKVAAHLDEDEFLEAEYIPEERVVDMLKNGEIRDAKTIIALQAYFLSKK